MIIDKIQLVARMTRVIKEMEGVPKEFDVKVGQRPKGPITFKIEGFGDDYVEADAVYTIRGLVEVMRGVKLNVRARRISLMLDVPFAIVPTPKGWQLIGLEIEKGEVEIYFVEGFRAPRPFKQIWREMRELEEIGITASLEDAAMSTIH